MFNFLLGFSFFTLYVCNNCLKKSSLRYYYGISQTYDINSFPGNIGDHCARRVPFGLGWLGGIRLPSAQRGFQSLDLYI